MKNNVRNILTGAAFSLALISFSYQSHAQTGATQMGPDSGAIAPSDVLNAAQTNPQGTNAGIQIAPGEISPQPAAPMPTPMPAAAPAPELAPAPVKHTEAATHKKKKATKKKSKKSASHASTSGKEHIRTAQENLELLGYTPGKADGLIGSKTRAAIKGFQTDHGLKATGKLDIKTFERISEEAGKKRVLPLASIDVPTTTPPTPEFFQKHPDFYGYYGQDYANPMQFGSPQAIPTRFGDMQIVDMAQGTNHQYALTLNGQQIFHAEGQPSVINVSRTFNMDGADAIVLTSYANGNTTCAYRHYLLIVRVNSNSVHELGNCTRPFEAFTQGNMLYVSFPEGRNGGWSSGDMWRYNNGTLQRL